MPAADLSHVASIFILLAKMKSSSVRFSSAALPVLHCHAQPLR